MATRQNKNLLADDFNNYLEGEINEKLLGNIQGDNIDETKMRNQFITAFKEDANEGMSRDDAMITFLVNIALYGASSASSNKYNIDFKVLTISNLMRCFIFDIYRAILGIQIEVEELDENDVSNALFTNNNPITDYTEKEWTLIASCIRERSILYKHHAKSNLSNEYVCCLILPGMYLIPKKMEISKFACAVFSCVSLSISEVAEARSDEATAEQAIIYMKKVSSLSRNMDMAELKEAMLHVEAIQKVKAIVGYSSSELLDIFVSYQDKETFKRAKILNEANLKRAKGTPKKKYSDLKSSTTNQNKTATTSTKQFVEVNNKVYFQDENGNLKLVNQDS